MITARPHFYAPAPRRRQSGASLFIALIILLLVTVFALSSTRETALESRITANYIEQQRLLNGAEAGLRDGESWMVSPIRPLDPTASCAAASPNTVPAPCLLSLRNNVPTYSVLFATSNLSRPYYPKDGTQADSAMPVRWYALPAPNGGASAQNENPESLQQAQGTGTFRYEINSKAATTATGNATYLRSTTAKYFDNGDR